MGMLQLVSAVLKIWGSDLNIELESWARGTDANLSTE